MTEVTQQGITRPTRRGSPFGIATLAALCLVGAAGLYFYEMHGRSPSVAPSAVAPTAGTTTAAASSATPPAAVPAKPVSVATAPTAAPAAPGPATAAPSVDVVRVDKGGNLVMAGRAAPGETLTIRNGGADIGTATAGDDGQWVFLPDAPLQPGAHQLTVSGPGVGATDTAHQAQVLLGLPANGPATAQAPGQTLKSGPLVVLSEGNAAPRLLAGPSAKGTGPVGLDIVQYDDQGRIRFTGHAEPGHSVRLYVNNKPVGDATADASGRWSLIPAQDLPPGLYSLRTDELGTDGSKVVARAEVPFARADLSHALKDGQAVVQPGDCLWTIAHDTYGHGVKYTAIVVKNRDQIRNPDLIYPGQVFHMPTTDEAAHAPPVSVIRKSPRGETSGG
ncbi:LysM peptidoglycan-binding domain-containing protein [Acidisoma sp. 7E03]